MTSDGAGGSRLSFLGHPVPPSFDVRMVTIPAGTSLDFDEGAWRDAIVVLEAGELEVECLRGGRRSFAVGTIMSLVGLELKTLHSTGLEPVVLTAVSRRTGTEDQAPARP
jgi:hypothetical protein